MCAFARMLVLSAAPAMSCLAQRVVGGATPPPFPPAKGTVTLHRTLPAHYIPDSLPEFYSRSTAVVESFVQTTLPPLEIPPRSLFTDALLVVTRVFKGPASLSTIVVGQPGGVVGGFSIKPTQYNMMQSGERYILFLRPETRRNLPEKTGATRFAVTGEWGGYFRIDSAGNIDLARSTSPALRSAYQGKSISQVEAEVLALLPQ